MLSILQIMAEYALCVHYKSIITPDNNKNYEFAFFLFLRIDGQLFDTNTEKISIVIEHVVWIKK